MTTIYLRKLVAEKEDPTLMTKRQKSLKPLMNTGKS